MALKIKANSFFVARFLQVNATEVVFMETAAMGGKRRFAFSEIECILMSPDHVLSFQVGNEVFSIPTKPDKAAHQETIAALVQRTAESAAQSPRSSGG